MSTYSHIHVFTFFFQELKLKNYMQQQQGPGGSSPEEMMIATTQASEMQSVTTSGVDPFLGQGGTTDQHTRQNSGDSGLGWYCNMIIFNRKR